MSGVNVPSHYYTQFAQNIDYLVQQKDSRLGETVRSGTHTGDKASPVDQIGSSEMSDITDRFATIVRTDGPLSRRWVFPIASDHAQMLDTFDALKLLLDPKSAYVQSATMAANRRKDRHIIGAWFADALTGVNAGTTETFGTTLTSSSGQNVAVSLGGTTSNLNVAKLKEAKRRLMSQNIDVANEKLWLVGSSKEHDSLLNEIQVVSMDFNEKAVLVDGLVTRFLGFNMKWTELITTGTDDAAGTSNQVAAYAEGAMYYGSWQTQTTDISQRKDLKGLPWQAYVMMMGASTRLEKERIVRIWCR